MDNIVVDFNRELPIPFWQNLPENVKQHVVQTLDLQTRFSLRKCSHEEMTLVDNVPIIKDRISVSFYNASVTLDLSKERIQYFDRKPKYNQGIHVEYTENYGDPIQTMVLGNISPSDLDLVIPDFLRVFNHNKSKFDEVVLQYAEGLNPERNQLLARKLVHHLQSKPDGWSIKTESFYIGLQTTGKEMLKILSSVEPKHLKHIRLHHVNLSNEEAAEFVKMDQWKKALSLRIEEKNQIPVKEFAHTETFWTHVEELEVMEAWKLIKDYIKNNPPRGSFFYVYSEVPIDFEPLKEKFGSGARNNPIKTPWKPHLVLHTHCFSMPRPSHVLIVLILNNVLTGRICHVEHLSKDCNDFYSDYFTN